DLDDENLRRLVVNSVFWGLDLDVPAKADVAVKGYNPTFYSFKGYKVGLKPEDFIPGAPNFAKAPLANAKKEEPKKKPAPKPAPKKPAPKKAESKLPPGVLVPMEPKAVAFKKTDTPAALKVNQGDHIVLVGSGLGSRMAHYGHFETELFLRFADKDITVRNMCDEGNTPGFRPHPGRTFDNQFAFPGAKELVHKRFQTDSRPQGHFETPDQWLTRLEADTIIAFFGTNSSYDGPGEVDRYKKELDAFLKHTLSRQYNGKSVPQVALVSPTAVQDLRAKYSVPSPKGLNENLELYTKASAEVAAANGVLFADIFSPSKGWFAATKEEHTIDGALLNDAGYRKLAPALANSIFGKSSPSRAKEADIYAAVQEKNWAWINDFKMPNVVHVFGRRYNPYGPANYPFEIKKTTEFNVNRD
ncbi:MAG: SGNH/GDSL hydrolase family protein, partial [Verrucomicrobiota bacterium]